MGFNDQKFSQYDPYLTYSNKNNREFIKQNGEKSGELDVGIDTLFKIGKKVADRLFSDCTRDEVDSVFQHYFSLLGNFRKLLAEMYEEGRFIAIGDLSGDKLVPDFGTTDDLDIINVSWQCVTAGMHASRKGEMEDETKDIFKECFFLYALKEIDNTLTYLSWGDDGVSLALASAVDAANALSNAIAIESGGDKEQEIRRDMGYRSAMEKLKRDPKQAEKTFVHSCWGKWQKKPERYKGKAAFARDMLDKCEHLTSQKKIEDWCREWEKENSTQLAR